MPHVSERQQSLQLLRTLLLHYNKGTWLQKALPFLPELYQYLKAKRYWAERGVVHKVGSWTTAVAFDQDDVRFKREARMDKPTFLLLLTKLERSPVFHRRVLPGRGQLLVALQIFIFLKFLSTGGGGGSYYAISQHFGVGEGTVAKVVARVTDAVIAIMPEYVYWPNSAERGCIAKRIQTKSGFRGVCGIIDGTTFPFAFKPQLDPEDYFSRKSVYCMSAQLICDDRRLIRKFLVGFPGSVHDMRQYRAMTVYQHPELYFDRDQYLLGDAAYGLSINMVRPFKSPESEIPRNKRFNYLLSTQRIAIEHTNGMLKSRFGRLRDGFRNIVRDEEDSGRVVRIITAAFVLHNFCIMHGDTYRCSYQVETDHEPAQVLHEDETTEEGKSWRRHVQNEVLSFNELQI